jgi:hypothetical protein
MGACTDLSQPSDRPEPSAQSIPQASADDPVGLARGVRGFGGFFLDRDGAPTLFLTDPAERGAAEQALSPYFGARGLDPSQLRVVRADFEYASLERWFERASPEALAVPGSVYADLDEAGNRLRIGVANQISGAEVSRLVAGLGIPTSAVVVEETAPIRQVSQLDQRVRPVQGGLQIDFILGLCSLGFNALLNGVSSFITASHCTLIQGGVEGTPYYQDVWFDLTGSTAIGTEVQDPPYFSGGRGKRSACPRNRVCRYSDAARAQYSVLPGDVALGQIAKTTGENDGSVVIAGSFYIDPNAAEYASDHFTINSTVHKVGRTTGWTSGAVSSTCANVNIDGTTITQLCQTLVGSEVPGSPVLVGAGDSGSPVFILNGKDASGNDRVTLAGILWGGTVDGGLFAFSPLVNIQRELGDLVVVGP